MTMDDDKTFYTVTMARVHTDQGRYDAAARIYRYLLEQEPGRSDLSEALSDVLARRPQAPDGWSAVEPLVAQWVRLTLRQRMLDRLRGVRHTLDDTAGGSAAGRGQFSQNG